MELRNQIAVKKTSKTPHGHRKSESSGLFILNDKDEVEDSRPLSVEPTYHFPPKKDSSGAQSRSSSKQKRWDSRNYSSNGLNNSHQILNKVNPFNLMQGTERMRIEDQQICYLG